MRRKFWVPEGGKVRRTDGRDTERIGGAADAIDAVELALHDLPVAVDAARLSTLVVEGEGQDGKSR